MNTPISAIHKDIHIDSLAHARRVRADGTAHARLLQLARDARHYFKQLRALGE